MPVESLPTRGGALWLDNWILPGTIAAYTDQHVNFPASNLLSPHRADTWQSNAVGSSTTTTVDVGAVRAPECFGLFESNLDGGAYIRLRGSDDSAGSTNPVYWDLPIYRQDAIGKALRWYLGDPTSGTLGAGRQFWGWQILPATFGSYNTDEDYYEIGVAWLGEYVPIIPWEDIRIRPKNPSPSSKAFGQSRWSFPLKPYREAEIALGGLTIAQVYELEEVVRAQGTKHALLDVHAFSSDAALKRGGCLYGYFAEDPLDSSVGSPEANEVTLHFEEADG